MIENVWSLECLCKMISEHSPTALISPMKNPLPFSNDGLFTIHSVPVDEGAIKKVGPCGLREDSSDY